MSLIRRFVHLNRTASAWVAKRFPGVFSNPKPSYRETLLDRVNRDIKNKKPGTVLEAGGGGSACP